MAEELYLVRDVLDTQVVGRDDECMGRVDGLVLALRKGAPPRVAFIEMGTVTLARRLHPRLAHWVASVGRHRGQKHRAPYRIPWSTVRDVGVDVDVDLDASRTPALASDRWLRDHIIGRIPGAG